MAGKRKVLFLCKGNSVRSQMAEGLLRHLGGDRYEVFSAGTHPKGLNPRTVEVMNEIGIDVARQESKDMTGLLTECFDHVITVCDNAREQCPVFPGARAAHRGFDDPAESSPGAGLEVFRRVRTEILQRIRLFLDTGQA